MKKVFTLWVTVLFMATLWAQNPEKMSYQAVIRNSDDALVKNTQIGMEINIRQGKPSGTVVYTETHITNTNANGLVSIEIGGGPGFNTVNWENGPYFIEIKTAIAPPLTTYTIIGTSQLLSVPYALHAKTAETINGGITETDPTFTKSQAAKITATNITNLGNLSGTNTGDQDLSALATTASVNTALGGKVDKVTGKGLSANDYTTGEKTKLAAISGTNTGDQDLSGLATTASVTTGLATKVDKVTGKGLSTEDYSTAEKTKLAAISGTNTGDQDLSGLATTASVTTALGSKVDKVTGKGLSTEDYTTAEKTKLAAITGTNTGDQDLSGLATTASVTTALGGKVDKVTGKGLSTEDYTSTEKSKLSGIASGAEVNMQADWNQATNTADDYIKNKPTIPTQYTDAMADARVVAGITNKVDKVPGKGLSTYDYTYTEKSKVSGIEAGAEVNVQADWNQATNTADNYIKNKPTIPTQYTDAMADARVVVGITNKVDKVTGKGLSTEDYSTAEKTKLAAISGTNTGDQDLSGLATTASVTTALGSKVDKVTGKGLSTEDYTTAEKTKLAAITGTNTGDQDLSGLATTASVTTALGGKVDKVTGKGLSTEDYTTAEKSKLDDIAAGAEVNVQADWNQATNTADDYIKNKPTIPTQYTDAMADARVVAGITNKVDKVSGKGLSTEDYTTAEQTKLAAISGTNTGDQDLSGLATTASVTTALGGKVDKVTGKGLSTEDYTTAEKTKLAAITGTNTGDQDLSGLATTASVTTALGSKVDKVTGKGLSTEDYTTAEQTKLAAISGSNTGDQDLSGLATTASVTTALGGKVDKETGKGLSANDYTDAEKLKLAGLSSTAVDFTGSLSGDVTGTQSLTVVSSVGGQTATQVATATVLANAATNTNTVNTIVKRDAGGNFSAETITASGLAITGGTPGTGKVLTSDASGNATWQAGGSSSTFKEITRSRFQLIDLNGAYILNGQSLGENADITDYRNHFIAPFDGKLLKIVVKSEVAMGSTIIKMHVNKNTTALETQTVDIASASTAYTFTFTSAAIFSAGDDIELFVDPTTLGASTSSKVSFTIVWEY